MWTDVIIKKRRNISNTKKNWKEKILIILAIVVILGLGGFLVYRFNFVEKSVPDDKVSRYLVCDSNSVQKYVLMDDMNSNVGYESRIMFINDEIYRVNFVVSERFSNEGTARAFTDKLYGAYNKYLGKNEIAQKDIIMTVTNVDNVGKMVISVEGGKYSNKMAPIVMLDGVDKSAGSDKVKEKYEESGFVCSVDEQDMVLSD